MGKIKIKIKNFFKMNSEETLVIDIGSGYTKVGFAGNFEPTSIFPSYITQNNDKTRNLYNSNEIQLGKPSPLNEMERVDILSHGQVKDWDVFERYLNKIYFDKLRADPEEHYSILTEPPMTPPESREKLAELMFETFNSPGFYLGVQAVMALFASRISKDATKELTGVVVDSGAGVTHIIPIIKGYVIGSCVESMPLAGGDINKFIASILRERGEDIPSNHINNVAAELKENFSYNCPDVLKEFSRFDDRNDSHRFKKYTYNYRGENKTIDVGYEQFLAPEIFFNPEMYGANFTTPLPELVDSCVRKAPMNSRIPLWNNIILSGGSTMFKGFDKRLQRDINHIIKYKHNNKKAVAKVITHSKQKYAVWFGASILGKIPEFKSNIHTKAKYEEIGPRIARFNSVFF